MSRNNDVTGMFAGSNDLLFWSNAPSHWIIKPAFSLDDCFVCMRSCFLLRRRENNSSSELKRSSNNLNRSHQGSRRLPQMASLLSIIYNYSSQVCSPGLIGWKFESGSAVSCACGGTQGITKGITQGIFPQRGLSWLLAFFSSCLLLNALHKASPKAAPKAFCNNY